MHPITPFTPLLGLLLLLTATPVLACKCWYTVGVPNYKFASKEMVHNIPPLLQPQYRD
jgi:hypothetical protein